MPFLRFHAVEKEKLAQVSTELTDRIVEVVKCPRENVVLEIIHSDYVTDNRVTLSWPFIEVSWFPRPVEIQDEVAKIVFDSLKKVGYENSDIHFTHLTARNYYENGIHY